MASSVASSCTSGFVAPISMDTDLLSERGKIAELGTHAREEPEVVYVKLGKSPSKEDAALLKIALLTRFIKDLENEKPPEKPLLSCTATARMVEELLESDEYAFAFQALPFTSKESDSIQNELRTLIQTARLQEESQTPLPPRLVVPAREEDKRARSSLDYHRRESYACGAEIIIDLCENREKARVFELILSEDRVKSRERVYTHLQQISQQGEFSVQACQDIAIAHMLYGVNQLERIFSASNDTPTISSVLLSTKRKMLQVLSTIQTHNTEIAALLRAVQEFLRREQALLSRFETVTDRTAETLSSHNEKIGFLSAVDESRNYLRSGSITDLAKIEPLLKKHVTPDISKVIEEIHTVRAGLEKSKSSFQAMVKNENDLFNLIDLLRKMTIQE